MILFLLLGAAALTWYLDKAYDNVTDLVNPKGENLKKDKKGNITNLGLDDQLSKNIPWGAKRTKTIGDWSYKNPFPLIDIQRGGERTRVQPYAKQPILPNQKRNFSRIVHNRENIEEYWRFDPYLGGVFPDRMPTYRKLAM